MNMEKQKMKGNGWIAEIEGAIFDMDGTLLDSMAVWEAVGEIYLQKNGVQPEPGLREALRPLSSLQAAEYFREHYQVGCSAAEIIEDINREMEGFYRWEVQLKPGVLQMLKHFSDAGIKMCVATATDRQLVEPALERTGALPYFTQIFTCGEVGNGKDRPDIFQRALEALNTSKPKTFVFEDALFAAQTVKAEGIPLAVVEDDSASGQRDQLLEIADVYIADWNDLFRS